MIQSLLSGPQVGQKQFVGCKSALGELVVQGIDTNIDFQFDIINDQRYLKGDIDTGFIETM